MNGYISHLMILILKQYTYFTKNLLKNKLTYVNLILHFKYIKKFNLNFKFILNSHNFVYTNDFV